VGNTSSFQVENAISTRDIVSSKKTTTHILLGCIPYKPLYTLLTINIHPFGPNAYDVAIRGVVLGSVPSYKDKKVRGLHSLSLLF
jgi:hypothetical protein